MNRRSTRWTSTSRSVPRRPDALPTRADTKRFLELAIKRGVARQKGAEPTETDGNNGDDDRDNGLEVHHKEKDEHRHQDDGRYCKYSISKFEFTAKNLRIFENVVISCREFEWVSHFLQVWNLLWKFNKIEECNAIKSIIEPAVCMKLEGAEAADSVGTCASIKDQSHDPQISQTFSNGWWEKMMKSSEYSERIDRLEIFVS